MYTIETSVKIFRDQVGTFLFVGPDADGLGLVTLYNSEDPNRIICITKEEALLLAQSIQKLYQSDSHGD